MTAAEFACPQCIDAEPDAGPCDGCPSAYTVWICPGCGSDELGHHPRPECRDREGRPREWVKVRVVRLTLLRHVQDENVRLRGSHEHI